MGKILQNRIGAVRSLPPGEALVLAITVAAGDLGAMIGEALRDHDVTPRQYNVLRMLRGAGAEGIAHGDIGRRLLARAPDVTRLMDQLVNRGWAARVRSDDDARVVLHGITDGGIAALDVLATPLQTCYERLLERLGPHDSQTLIALCEQVIESLSSNALPGART